MGPEEGVLPPMATRGSQLGSGSSSPVEPSDEAAPRRLDCNLVKDSKEEKKKLAKLSPDS